MRKLRLNSLVRFASWFKDFAIAAGSIPADSGFYSNETFVYLGEIINMPSHVIVVGLDGIVYFGYHPENFEEVPEDET